MYQKLLKKPFSSARKFVHIILVCEFSIMLGLHCRSDQLGRPDCLKVPYRTRSMACTRLLLERYSIMPDSSTSAQDSYTTSTRLKPDRYSSKPISTGSLHGLFTNSSINTRFLHEQYSTNSTNERRLDLNAFF